MTDDERYLQQNGQLRNEITAALSERGYITGLHDDLGIRWVSDETKTAELWNVNGDAETYIENLAHDLMAVFGQRAMLMVGPIMIINKTYNLYQHSEISKALEDFDLMQAMNGGGQ